MREIKRKSGSGSKTPSLTDTKKNEKNRRFLCPRPQPEVSRRQHQELDLVLRRRGGRDPADQRWLNDDEGGDGGCGSGGGGGGGLAALRPLPEILITCKEPKKKLL